MLRKPIQLGTFFNGQSSLGKLEQNKWLHLTNCDIHTEVGMVMPQLAMVSESTTPNEPCIEATDHLGNVYAFSTTSGKVWKRAIADASYTLVHTNSDGSGHTGARYFNGYLWYWTTTKLDYYNLASTWTDSTAHFATGTRFSEGIEANNTLLIGNGRWVARIDAANTFSLSEFVIPAMYYITTMKNIGDDVLIGTKVSDEVAYCRVFLWDTVSPAWSYEDEIFEIGVNCFMQLDNITIAQCGKHGRFYYWTGSQMAYFNKINGITTGDGYQKSCVFNGRPLFANGNKIYSIHKEDTNLPFAVCGEYTCTGTINSLFVQGQNLLASVGTGIDKRGTSYATAIIESPEIQTQISILKVGYDVYPQGIGIETNVNGAGYVSQDEKIDEKKREVYFDGGIVDGFTTLVRLTLTPSGLNIPKVKYISLQ